MKFFLLLAFSSLFLAQFYTYINTVLYSGCLEYFPSILQSTDKDVFIKVLSLFLLYPNPVHFVYNHPCMVVSSFLLGMLRNFKSGDDHGCA